MGSRMRSLVVLATAWVGACFHDCVQTPPVVGRRRPPGAAPAANDAPCSGGLCVGMHDGPHEGGPASYPVGDAATGFTTVSSTMTVPAMPEELDGITYYIWTDIFFGDMSLGRMNQFVPQLLLGSVLDASTGAPLYAPSWHTHHNWTFGAHYFFETHNATTNATDAHAAYGPLFPASPGETLVTTFAARAGADGPAWTLTMAAAGDASRVSTLVVERPYMGLGAGWPTPTTSWAEENYTRLCVNACWELYGADDRAHEPGSGARYDIAVAQGSAGAFEWVEQWDEDEGGGACPTSTIAESHNDTVQHVLWDISLPASS